MTEKEKMLNGLLYDPSDSELAEMRKKAHKLCKQYNDTYEDEEQKRNEIISELLPNFGKGTYLQGPIQFDYGVFTTFGEKCAMQILILLYLTVVRYKSAVVCFSDQTVRLQLPYTLCLPNSAVFVKETTAPCITASMQSLLLSKTIAGLPQTLRSAAELKSEKAR